MENVETESLKTVIALTFGINDRVRMIETLTDELDQRLTKNEQEEFYAGLLA